MTTEITESWYNQLVEDLRDLITEVEFTSRWTLVEGYHSLGSRILQENDNFERAKIYGQDIVQRLAESLQKRPRTIYYAIQFAKEYPDLNLLPEGKNTSWNHIIGKYLTDGTEKKTIRKADLFRMIKEIKELLSIEWLKANQEWLSGYLEWTNIPLQERIKAGDASKCDKCEYIRYLQDQVNKIVGGLDE